jgi:hypothetical protein
MCSPPLTTAALTGEHGEAGHGDHEGYDASTLARAITQGIDAGGAELDSTMPRWQMSRQDLGALVDYLLGIEVQRGGEHSGDH